MIVGIWEWMNDMICDMYVEIKGIMLMYVNDKKIMIINFWIDVWSIWKLWFENCEKVVLVYMY